MNLTRERRRSVRIPIPGAGEMHVPLKLPVRVLDISLTGRSSPVICRSRRRPRAFGGGGAGPAGGRLYVSRRRVEPVASGGTFGAAFVNLDDQNQKCLEQFLKRASE